MFRFVLSTFAAAAVAASLAYPVAAQNVAGSYLAGRQAALRSDYTEAARYYAQAMAQDPGNVELIESAALSYLSLGEIG